MKIRMSIAALAIAALSVPAYAANITFNTPVTISGDNDISTSGTFVSAYHFGDNNTLPPNGQNGGLMAGTVPVNGVTFTAFPLVDPALPTATLGNVTISASGGAGIARGYNGLGSTSVPFSTLSNTMTDDYQGILSSAVYNDSPADDSGKLTLTLGGLTAGQQYQIELFVDDSRGDAQGDLHLQNIRTETFTGGANTSSSLQFNTSSAATNPGGGVGQYVIGTFTADNTLMQSIMVTPGGSSEPASQIQAFELRAVPEPASIGLLVASLFLCRRSRA